MLVDRAEQNTSDRTHPSDPPPYRISNCLRLILIAVPLIVQIASAQHPTPLPIFAVEAIYLRATVSAFGAGAYLDHVQHNPRVAFRDKSREQGMRRLGSTLAVITKVSTIRCMPATALCERRINESCVYVCSFRFHTYIIVHGDDLPL